MWASNQVFAVIWVFRMDVLTDIICRKFRWFGGFFGRQSEGSKDGISVRHTFGIEAEKPQVIFLCLVIRRENNINNNKGKKVKKVKVPSLTGHKGPEGE